MTGEEEELLEEFNSLNRHEKDIIWAKISELAINKKNRIKLIFLKKKLDFFLYLLFIGLNKKINVMKHRKIYSQYLIWNLIVSFLEQKIPYRVVFIVYSI